MASDPFRFDITLLPYLYSQWGENSIIVFVDADNPSPDSSYAGTAKLLWGYGVDGERIEGDYRNRFERVGKPIKWAAYYPRGRNPKELNSRARILTMRQLNDARVEAIKRKIRTLGPEDLG